MTEDAQRRAEHRRASWTGGVAAAGADLDRAFFAQATPAQKLAFAFELARDWALETRMHLHADLHDLLAAFAKHRVSYMLIGGYAVAAHAIPRFTKDLDLWLEPSGHNLDAVVAALKEFGAPENVIAQVHSAPALDVLWFGAVPNRIDLMKAVPGGDFASMSPNSMVVEIDGVAVTIIGKADLRKIKLASGRAQDLADAKALE